MVGLRTRVTAMTTATTKEDEYQRFAREALDLAEHSRSEADRASWARIAQKWIELVPQQRRPED
jgi:hypothetical protein